MRKVTIGLLTVGLLAVLVAGCDSGPSTGTSMNPGTAAEGNSAASNPAMFKTTDMKKQMSQSKKAGGAKTETTEAPPSK